MKTKPLDLTKKNTEHELIRRIVSNQLESKFHYHVSEIGIEYCESTRLWNFEVYGWDSYTGKVRAYYGYIGTLGQIVISGDSTKIRYDIEEYIEL